MVYVISNIYGLLDVNDYEILEQGGSIMLELDEELIVYTMLSFIGGIGIGLIIASYMGG